jgi:DNA-binding HxlR family transcriptional regulator
VSCSDCPDEERIQVPRRPRVSHRVVERHLEELVRAGVVEKRRHPDGTMGYWPKEAPQ